MIKEFKTTKLNINNQEAKDLFSNAFKEKAENTSRLFETLLKDSLHLSLMVNNEMVSQ